MKKLRIGSVICANLFIFGGMLALPSSALALPPKEPIHPHSEINLPITTNVAPSPSFLTMPFTKKCEGLKITEGWLYSPDERAIHGNDVHYGVDFACPRDTPVVAMADGYAVRSYHAVILERTHEGKQIGYGLGEFVQIWHPKPGVYSLYAHLSKAEDGVNYVETQKVDDSFWNPVGIYKPTEEIMKLGTPVKRGQVIGYAGDSGLSWGYNEDFQLTPPHHVLRPDPATHPSWDEIHVHTEIYTRLPDGSRKDKRYDPFDVYGQVRPEYSPYKKMRSGPNGLWITKLNGKPCYSDKLGNFNCPAPVED